MYTYKCIENERELTASPSVVAGTTVGSVVKKLRNNSYFVNVSKDVIKTLESANLSYGNYNNERKKVAVILGNDKNNIKVRNYYANSHNISNVSKVPMIDEARSLNLSNSVAIITYEILRQHDFEDLQEVSTYFES